MTNEDLKQILIDYAKRTYRRGLVGGTGGNFGPHAAPCLSQTLCRRGGSTKAESNRDKRDDLN